MLTIAHVALSVSDIDKSIAFYGKNFGFRCVEKFDITSSKLRIRILKRGATALELFEFKKHKSLPKHRKELSSELKTLGTKHVAFAVDDIGRIYRKLKKSRVRFATDIRRFENGLKYFFLKDPDGILIEVIEEGNK